ncbi:MAG: 16S rRNA (cytosine(1402)-N(4))-methyltransferase RsmH [Planctomycetota bacterium]
MLASEVLGALSVSPGEMVADATLGRGGHALMLAEAVSLGGTLVGLDRDPDNLEYAEQRLRQVEGVTVELHHANFAQLPSLLDGRRVDGLLADFGVSTNQLLDEQRGLSFAHADAPLDMRLDPTLPDTAADLLRYWPEKRIADTIYKLGDERFSRRIARRIVEARKQPGGLTTVGQLADLVRRSVPRPKGGRSKIDPATRTFMALRMAVNGELDAISSLLSAVPQVLAPGGRAAIISFHSGEDRLVKNVFRELASHGVVELVTKKPIVPSEEEIKRNPRSRSAKLRVVRRSQE